MSQQSRTPLLIFPCNGNGLEALDCLDGQFDMIGFIDDDPGKQGSDRYGCRVLPRRALEDFPAAQVLAVPGRPDNYLSRRTVIEGLRVPPERYARVIHPSARISQRASLGHNLLIMAGVVITGNAAIGNHVCILPNSVIHHDSRVEDWCLIGSTVTIAGNARIGENCYIGSGSSIINDAVIGRGTLVGLGTNVISPIPAGVSVVGNPARPIR